MSGLSRRQLLQRLAGCVATAGSVVLAQAVLAESAAATPPDSTDPAERAERLADGLPVPPDGGEYVAFLNGAFRNAGFRNAGFRNAGFRNGAFRNGAFRNGGFRNGAFRNW
ncbi:MAG: hypothetical protein U0736_22030 [Gemmataceae bacterium]